MSYSHGSKQTVSGFHFTHFSSTSLSFPLISDTVFRLLF